MMNNGSAEQRVPSLQHGARAAASAAAPDAHSYQNAQIPSAITTGQDVCKKKMKEFYDESYLYIEQGLACDEQGQSEQALVLYTKGLRIIDHALDIPVEGSECVGREWDSIRRMRAKLMKSKVQIQSRAENLIRTDPVAARSIDDPPPSYEQATTPTQSDFDVALSESLAADDLRHGQAQHMASAIELYQIRDGVQIFFITPEGYVSAPSYPSSLGIYKFSEHLAQQVGTIQGQTPPAFLKVGDWTYPLLPGRSPVLQSDYGAYIFPDLNAPQGSAVGLILPDSVSSRQRAELEATLAAYTALRNQLSATAPTEDAAAAAAAAASGAAESRTSTQIAQGMETASRWLSWGLSAGAQKAGGLIKLGSRKLQEHLKSEEQKTHVDPRVQTGLRYTRTATGKAVQVSAFIVRKLGEGTVALARKAMPAVKQSGEKLLPKYLTEQKDGQSKMGDVAEVLAGGLRGFSTVYIGLENAAQILAKAVGSETVSLVQHKYGDEAGQATGLAVQSVGNVALVAYTADNLGIKAIVKRAAKDSGKVLVEQYDPSPQPVAGISAAAGANSAATEATPNKDQKGNGQKGNA